MNLIEMLERAKEQLPEGEVVDFKTASHGVEFTAVKTNDDVCFLSNGGHTIPVKWPEFQQVLSLLIAHPNGVKAGNAINHDEGVGKGNCKLDTIEGQISHFVYGRVIGENPVTRRATYIMPVLLKAGLITYENSTFKLK